MLTKHPTDLQEKGGACLLSDYSPYCLTFVPDAHKRLFLFCFFSVKPQHPLTKVGMVFHAK